MRHGEFGRGKVYQRGLWRKCRNVQESGGDYFRLGAHIKSHGILTATKRAGAPVTRRSSRFTSTTTRSVALRRERCGRGHGFVLALSFCHFCARISHEQQIRENERSIAEQKKGEPPCSSSSG